jgi:hypothetical protein
MATEMMMIAIVKNKMTWHPTSLEVCLQLQSAYVRQLWRTVATRAPRNIPPLGWPSSPFSFLTSTSLKPRYDLQTETIGAVGAVRCIHMLIECSFGSGSDRGQKEATGALLNLAENDKNKVTIVAARLSLKRKRSENA